MTTVGRRQYAVLYGAMAITMLAGLATYSLAGRLLPDDGLSAYAVGRRVSALVLPGLLLGVGNGLTRYVAWNHDGRGDVSPGAYLRAAMTVVLVTGALTSAIALLAPAPLGHLLFDESDRGTLALWVLLVGVGSAIHAVNAAYVRGQLSLTPFAILQVLGAAVVPLCPFALGADSAESVFRTMAIGYALIAAPTMVALLRRTPPPSTPVTRARGELLSYGLRRVVGDVALAGLFALPALLVTHDQSVEAGGYVAIGAALVTLAGTAFAPVGVILLPQVSRMLRDGGAVQVQALVRRALVVGTALSVVGTGLFALLAAPLLGWWLGPGHDAAVAPIRIVTIAAVPYALFVLLRSVIDAATTAAVNARNTLVGLSVLLAGAGAGVTVGVAGAVLWSTVAGFATLALLTMRSTAALLASPEVHG